MPCSCYVRAVQSGPAAEQSDSTVAIVMPVPMPPVPLLLAVCMSATILQASSQSASRSFSVDYKRNVFVKDGKPFQMLGGSMHYFRVPRVYWRDRMMKLKIAGLNTVTTYVEWSLHEAQPGRVDFSGELDLLHFIELAEMQGLQVNLRVGPYICAERDMGGLPPWLLSVKPDIHLRSSDPVFQYYTKRWLEVLLPLVRPKLYGNGGPIILVQVENEYGSYPRCDGAYTRWLRDLFLVHVGSSAVLYTTDGDAWSYLQCGKIPGVYATVDFGSSTNVTKAFAAQRTKEPHGPLVNSEYYLGWLTHWGETLQTANTQAVARTLKDMLEVGANINFYVFVGGSNFAFTAGANYGPNYSPQLTSYDYDAPLTEAGDPTDKYFAIQEILGKYVPLPPAPRPVVAPKASLGPVVMTRVVDMFSLRSRAPVRSLYPYDFEQLVRQASGFVLYETTVPHLFPTVPYTASNLSAPAIRDRGIVFLGTERVGTLCRSGRRTWIPIGALSGQKLSILVENQGRINYGKYLNDSKGLGNVTLNGITLIDWVMTGYPLDNGTSLLQQVIRQADVRQSFQQQDEQDEQPAAFLGSFQLPPNNTTDLPLDSFLETSNWGKGVAFLNGFNLGRYWPAVGPQMTLYVPGHLFKPYPRTNHLLLVELDRAPSIPHLSFIDHPILNGVVQQAC